MQEAQVQVTKPVSTPLLKMPGMNQLVSSKGQIPTSYPDILKVLADFQGLPITYKLTQISCQSKLPADQFLSI